MEKICKYNFILEDNYEELIEKIRKELDVLVKGEK